MTAATKTARRTTAPLWTRGLAVIAVSGALLLSACSGGDEAASSSSPGADSAAPSASSSAPASDPATGSASPSTDPEKIIAVLCDEATEESVAAIEAAVSDEFTVSQVVDVRTDDEGSHAILAFVEGPGLAVLAQWTGTGLGLTDLAAADEFAAQVSDLPMATPDEATQDLLSQTVTCYSTLFAPDESDGDTNGDTNKDKKKDKKDQE